MGLKKKAEQNWKAGEQLIESGHFDSAANRLYYALYQLVTEYAKTQGVRWKRGKNTPGVHKQAENFVKKQFGSDKKMAPINK